MKAKIILVALALFLGAIGYTVQAQCSADCQCGKTTEDKTLAVGNRKVADFSMIRLEAVGDIFFTQSDRCSVQIGSRNIQFYVFGIIVVFLISDH